MNNRFAGVIGLVLRNRAGLVACAMLAVLTFGCKEEQFGEYLLAEIAVTPTSLTFDSREIGDATVQYLTIENIGSGELIIETVDLDTRSTEFWVEGSTTPFTLEAGGTVQVQVWYSPADCRGDRGNLLIHSNASNSPDITVPLQPQSMTGQVWVNPSPVDFGRVPANQMKTVTVTVTNVGTCGLTVNDLFLTGSFDFKFTAPAEEGVLEVEPALPFTLETEQSNQFDITYMPANDGFDQALLMIRSDDASRRTIEVPVYANGDEACIIVTDETTGIDFGERFIGEVSGKTITVTNCSQQQDLLVDGITLGEHAELIGLERYSLDEVPSDLDTNPWVIPPQDSENFILNYEPILYTTTTHPDLCTTDPCEVVDGAVLSITSNDEVKSPLDIDVRGVGTNNHCPVAVARARVQMSGDPWDTQIDTIPLATLELDASQSYDAEGSIASYAWEVTRRPPGSTANFQPNGSVANPTFFLDFAGQYVFTLRVFDNTGVESCESATIMAVVTPAEHIHVQLYWDTNGTDVDLHFLHPNASVWNFSPWDCFYANRNPNWGTSSRDDDPSLDIDDVDGYGPENINLDGPEGTTSAPFTYRVGIFYYSDHGRGASTPTVKIFLDGTERFSATMPNLTDRQFWDVARITWPTRDIERIHRLYPSGYPPL
ncbi:MAG: choice-of-anchor D domain-containing protein [Bradymonadales bacterium]|nr:choice-of-anchor D domain-containing protein [Bradymonadales bacterium]